MNATIENQLISEVELKPGVSPGEYAEDITLAQPVSTLISEAKLIAPALSDRTLWMINSSAKGGGVAEMLPKQVCLLRHLGIKVRWVVIGKNHPEFFILTKRLHNLIHGEGDPHLSSDDRALYDTLSKRLADCLNPYLNPHDVLIIHDPQPAGMGFFLKQHRPELKTVWRCHVGLETENQRTLSAWDFLKPYLSVYDHSVFSASAYIADYLAKNVSVIRPAIDPWAHKNRELHPVKLVGILSNSGLLDSHQPVLTPPFAERVRRLGSEGDFSLCDSSQELGLLFRPTVTQISRWDRLKGWLPLLEGFVRLKQGLDAARYSLSSRNKRRLEIVRLILAGPDPGSVQDDPEAKDVLDEIRSAYLSLNARLQADIGVFLLPMQSVKHNGLIVNALQRSSSLVVQNSIREGFGLVVTEAMWKRTPVLGSTAYGIRQQIREGIEGALIADPADPEAVETALLAALEDPYRRAAWARSAQRHVYDEFLIFRQLGAWLQLLKALVS